MTAFDSAVRALPKETGRLWVFCSAALLAILGGRFLPLSSIWMWFAVAGVAVAIWHGAFDGVLAEEALKPRYGPVWRPAFYVSYIALAAVVVSLWYLVPALALALFLGYSALHFGTESESRLSPLLLLTGCATGFLPIAAACHFWPGQVTAIFNEMLRGQLEGAAAITLFSGRILWVVVALATLGALRKRSHALVPMILIATELARECSPVPAFAVFFCLWHTPEHLVSTSLDRRGIFHLETLTRHLRRGLIPWLLALAATAAVGWFGRHTAQAYVSLLFVVLSALTVPHMVLAEVFRRSLNFASDRTRTTYAPHNLVNRG
jgi:Brp/Blh family beta-carotene 15,15'-monooxygenase